MENFYPFCIFCGETLTKSDKKGAGEHIIPQNLYGSCTTKDVCKRCNNLLGQSVDPLAIEDQRIISAVFQLNLPELQAAILDRGTGRSIDMTDGSELLVRFKNGMPKVMTRKVCEDLLVCDESESHKHLFNLIRKNHGHRLSESQIADIIRNEIAPKYDRLSPGDSVKVPWLDLHVTKKPCKIEHECRVTKGACQRLVAKIGYEFAWMAFTGKRRRALSTELCHLANVAMGRGELKPPILLYPIRRYSWINEPPHGPKYHHQMIVWYEDYANFIDIYFFGCVGFRLMLSGVAPDAYGPCPSPEGDLVMLSIVMTFEPGAAKTRHGWSWRVGQSEPEQHLFP